MPSVAFIDPSGHLIELKASNEGELRQLVAKKLAQGWRQASGAPVAPLEFVQTIASAAPPPPAPEPAPIISYGPSLEERLAAIDEAVAENE